MGRFKNDICDLDFVARLPVLSWVKCHGLMHNILDLECGPIRNFNFMVRVICSFMSNNLLMAILVISSSKAASKTIIFCSFGFTSTFSFEKNGIDPLGKLKQEFPESITPSSSKRFLIPNTRSTFSCISETKVKISNLWFWIVIITGMTNNTPTYCPLPT